METVMQFFGYNQMVSKRNLPRPTEMIALAIAVAVMAISMIPAGAYAFTTPVAGSFAYEVYDIGVNSILKGPIGFIAGVLLIVYGGLQVLKSWMIGIAAILVGGMVVKADTVVVSLGALVQ